ncbi:MAG: hypothetical protein JXB32_13585 [Deltaproteobacteria bacterium]|nr:hypothetical protein [Deltaproteobacteria bacterium]
MSLGRRGSAARVVRGAVAAVVLPALAACCAGAWSGVPCLTGDDPRAADARRQWTLAREASGADQICALEQVPSFFHDYSDQLDAPTCAPEFVERMEEAIFADEPIEFSRLLLARIRAVGAVGDTTDVMPQKAALLLRLVELPDEALSDYRPLSGEPGPPPEKDLVRRVALFELAGSNLYLNVPEARAWLAARVAAPRDDGEALAVRSAADHLLSDTLWGHPEQAIDNGAFAVLRGWIDDVPRRCAGAWAPESFELLLVELEALGHYAGRFGMSEAARAALEAVLEPRARVPLVEGRPAARHDLYVAATLARFDLDGSPEGVSPPGSFRPWREQPKFYGIDRLEPALYGDRGVDCGPRPERPRGTDEHAAPLAAGLAGDEQAFAAGRQTLAGLLELARQGVEGPPDTNLYDVVARTQAVQTLGRWADAYGLSAEQDLLLERLSSSSAPHVMPATVFQRAAAVARAERELAAEAAARDAEATAGIPMPGSAGTTP